MGDYRDSLADDWAIIASSKHGKAALVEYARAHGLGMLESRNKRDLCWHLARRGLINSAGELIARSRSRGEGNG